MNTSKRNRQFKLKPARLIALFAVATWAVSLLAADGPNVSITPRNSLLSTATSRATLKVDVSMVLVPVRVTDLTDRPVTDLSRSSFRLFEDNIEQTILSVHTEDGPVSVGFVFDASGSMKKQMDCSIAAVQQFLSTHMLGDEYFLIRFSYRPAIITGFTENPKEILDALWSIQPEGYTALNDAIYLGLHEMKCARNERKALFVLTDGGDNNSRYSDPEVRNLVQESDVRIYSVGMFQRSNFLERLATDSGGRAHWVHKLNELPEAIEKLSREFRQEYVLGYTPNEQPNDGKYRRVRVEIVETINRTPLNVFWRRGYYSPFY